MIKIRILFEHLLASEKQMQHMFKKSFSHYALVVIELNNVIDNQENILVIDERPFLKRISDRKRVEACRSFWKNYFNDRI